MSSFSRFLDLFRVFRHRSLDGGDYQPPADERVGDLDRLDGLHGTLPDCRWCRMVTEGTRVPPAVHEFDAEPGCTVFPPANVAAWNDADARAVLLGLPLPGRDVPVYRDTLRGQP